MPKHFDVRLIKVVHVIVPEDASDPEEAAIEEAIQEFIVFLSEGGVAEMLEHSVDFWATDSRYVYPTATQDKPCEYCEED